MVAKRIDGNKISLELRNEIKQKVELRLKEGKTAPNLAVILVGNDPASNVYVNKKINACHEIGFKSTHIELDRSVSQEQLIEEIRKLNDDKSVNGILVQLPLPDHLDASEVIETISPLKDVDCFHPYNIGRLVQRIPLLRPCTPYGVIHMLDSIGFEPRGRHAVIVGASNIVGRPMAMELLLRGATVTVCHKFTDDLPSFVSQADLLVVGVGIPNLVKGNWIKPDAVVIDVGINRMDNGQLTGDVEFDVAEQRASWITPVPGGVGPMTVAMLMKNTLMASEMAEENTDMPSK
ncbi:MAG: bifunctional methylenetetrahydrofolate dehydrogenase/methenyltetrahydrofolate cyclohydrolase FolD [Gammaproteobacteria bacterium]|nr:bifunctional methylenetetrahydrofolate dehydrogenase/methenyltetrahydrofolate cyclohydrolase FolD [Gammaproteobacteria bacterium]MDH5628517.1 bifunctional methylenetetrahydrofolate dehydrogenase/methenyltetrahydrofolate cyclohydrolase FolD [Gammaproteobacteria bacterium]